MQEQVTAVLQRAGDAVESAETAAVTVYLEHSHRGTGDPVASQHTRIRVVALDVVGELLVELGRLDDVEVNGPSWGLRPDSPATSRPGWRRSRTPSDGHAPTPRRSARS